MKVLLIGGGAREHAIAAALKRNPELELYGAMKNRNPGIMRLCEEVSNHDETDLQRTVDFARRTGVDFAFVGPEAPLAAGAADALEEAGIPCIGPRSALARIESDKEFTRGLLDRHKIPCNLRYRVFDDADEASRYLDDMEGEVAVKPVGLTGGKGVKVMGEQLRDRADAKRYIREVVEGGIGGGRVILEEKALGEEFTLQAFVDGKNVALMPAVQDHKRAFEGDRGHNTGGMGSYSDSDHLLPFLKPGVYEKAGEVVKKTVQALRDETGEDYRGILYGQFMLGRELKLIEFNCRFGDPEAMNVLSIMEGDLGAISEAIIDGSLGQVGFQRKATVCKYVVPEGYGVSPVSGELIHVDEKGIEEAGALLYYAAVNERDGEIYTTTSRSIGVVGVAGSIEEAERVCEEGISHISGAHIYHRRDIGTKELIAEKLERMRRF
ncbi:MAG: phosphoribosylamine--glycine ligase [Methanobacteriota archaeon]|nr:MAG: phosphoribosylamine--glycine ligase [Euryarchaeota archaeon]